MIFLVIAAIALAVRLNYVESPGFEPDLRSFAEWMRVIQTHGLLNFYEPQYRVDETDRTYPPLSTAAFGLMANAYGTVGNARLEVQRPAFVTVLKVLPIAADLAMILAVYIWLSAQPVLQRLITTALALFPAMVIVSGWWGQYDATYTVFLLLALISLNKDRPLWAWFWFALALLVKQPAMFFAPLILVLTFRRYGWRKTLWGMVLCGGLCAIAFAPFILTSGIQNALSPYLQAGDTFPFLTNNAYNTWYLLGSRLTGGAQVVFRDPILADAQIWFAGLSYKLIGLLAFGAFILWLMVLMWRHAGERREFLWGALLYFGFFMLPTQVHERYLYTAAILTVIALAQDTRLWWVAIGVMITFSYNIMAVLRERVMLDVLLSPGETGVACAGINVVLFLALLAYTVVPERPASAVGSIGPT
ncbi:MAG: hypothetical protein U0670_23660 [Anaerolineae bacterium]